MREHTRRSLLRHLAAFTAAVVLATAASAQVSISNIRARQLDDGIRPVEVLYDLSGAPAQGARITIAMSLTGSAPYDIVPASSDLSGAVGDNVANGTDLQILWDVAASLPSGTRSESCRISLVAVDPTLNPEQLDLDLADGVTLTLVRVPAGTFLMGAGADEVSATPDEQPQHQVTISQDYYVGETEVTQAQWEAVMGESMPATCGNFGVGDDYPVYCVSWEDIAGVDGFLSRLNDQLETSGLRLPSEAEWERAARADTTTRFSHGDALECNETCGFCALHDQYMVWCGNSNDSTEQVASRAANDLGLYDMHGNVWEWVNDWYADNAYSSAAVQDPTGPTSGTTVVVRGGSWYNNAADCRSASRSSNRPDFVLSNLGFRLARSQESAEVLSSMFCVGCEPPSVPRRFTSRVTVPAERPTMAVNLPGGVDLTLVKIPAGTFMMGAGLSETSANLDEYPQHEVTLSEDYYIGKYEVTQAQWEAVMGSNPASGFGVGDDYPVYNVSWDAITQTDGFLDRLNTLVHSSSFRLPTEAEWERAARAETTTRFSHGDVSECSDACETCERHDLFMVYCGNSGNQNKPVGTKGANAYGLFDMHGNVFEWVSDYYDVAYYQISPSLDPTGPESGTNRAGRGGSSVSEAADCRSAVRANAPSTYSGGVIGFRIAWSPPPAITTSPVLTGSATSPYAIQLNWTALDNTLGYELFRGQTLLTTGTALSFADSGLEPSTEYCYTVRAYNEVGPGPSSDELCVTTQIWIPDQEITVTLPGGVEMELVLIPAGTFMMGSPGSELSSASDEHPLHQVELTEDYYIGKYEVTQAQWEAIMGSNPASGYGEGDSYPVYNVSWNDVAGTNGFLDKLNDYLNETRYRLPTEAEWERAARAGTSTRFSYGDALECGEVCEFCTLHDQYMVWCGNHNSAAEEVGSKEPNDFGLYDMHGNVWEWVSDWYGDNYYASSPAQDPPGPSSGTYRVKRGGAWFYRAQYCRSAYRSYNLPSSSNNYLGFRVVRPL